MAAAPAPPQRRVRVYDRPVHHDPLLWAGLVLGVALVLMGPPTGSSSGSGVVVSVVLRFVAGVGIAAFFGGFVRNLVRALAHDDDKGQEDA